MYKEKIKCLNLIGDNEEDLKVISAYLQDSIVVMKDIVFLKKNKSFVMVVNRFMWEDVEKGFLRSNKRVRSAVRFEGIIQVRSKNINQKNTNKILEYLAMKCDSDENGNKKIKIFFSGNGMIILTSEAIDVVMNDLGKPWNVKSIPKHEI
tara:strand:- start:448 stop:897 length:450 start_codon:yes stop_codon:yes gene_type:complete